MPLVAQWSWTDDAGTIPAGKCLAVRRCRHVEASSEARISAETGIGAKHGRLGGRLFLSGRATEIVAAPAHDAASLAGAGLRRCFRNSLSESRESILIYNLTDCHHLV